MPALPYPSLPAWFEAQAELTPSSVAVTFEDKSITYDELNRQANQVARRLGKLGVGPEKIVALCLERSLDLVIALLGIQKAGGAYLPVDPALPQERQAMMLKDAGAALVYTQDQLVPLIDPAGAPIFNIDAERASLAQEDSANAPLTVAAENLAYLMYTSGSTGVPKGVEIEQAALVNFLHSMQQAPGLKPRDVLVAVTTLSFDIAGLEIFLPLVTGARVVLLSRDDAADGFRLLEHLRRENATVLQATPATWRMLLVTEWANMPNLKMLCGGEGLPRDLANKLLERGGELWNMYGPTETTIWSAVARVQADNAPINIGQPVANQSLHILDANLQPVPMGVTGELHIGGLGLARGYHNRPELTAEKFIRDPFSSDSSARLYKTGDVARMRIKGQVEVLGRVDHQVKIRGFRIELGEIEARLAEHPQVKESVVIAREDTPGRKQLVAYIVAADGAHVSEIREFLEKQLPDYMVPAFFELLQALPKTPNGKINRKALPRPTGQSLAAEKPYVAPTNAVETRLADVWQQVLGREKVGIHDNIFEIGGDSLLIFQIAARANQAGLPINVRQVFQLRTIAELAVALGDVELTGAEPSGPAPIAAISREAFRRPRANAHP